MPGREAVEYRHQAAEQKIPASDRRTKRYKKPPGSQSREALFLNQLISL